MSVKDPILELRHARVRLGVTQQEIADTLGRAKKTVIRWEQRHYDPSLADLVSWAEALGLRLAFVSLGDVLKPVSPDEANVSSEAESGTG